MRAEWDKLPEEIQEKMLYYQEEQGNTRNPGVFKSSIIKSAAGGGFSWSKTKEGSNFWTNILDCSDFDEFFKRYPKNQFLTIKLNLI